MTEEGEKLMAKRQNVKALDIQVKSRMLMRNPHKLDLQLPSQHHSGIK